MGTKNVNCDWCSKPLPDDAKSNRRFCNRHCASDYAKKQWREKNPKSPMGRLATGTVAEVNEMRVAIDLLRRGCNVYRAAFQGMPSDMLVYPKGWLTPLRIEVTSGNFTTKGKLAHPNRDGAQFDVLAVVVGDDIHYIPELEKQ